MLGSRGVLFCTRRCEEGSVRLSATRILFLGAALVAKAAFAAEPVPTGKLPDTAIPLSYALNLRIDPHAERFDGRVRIHVRLATAADHLWLHARELHVTRATVVEHDGRKHAATLTVRDPSGVAELAFGATLPAQELDLEFDYTAPFSHKLQGLYKVAVGADPYIVTQMEAISARYAFPGFDEPRFKTPFDVTLTVPKNEVAVANMRPRPKQPPAGAKWKTIAFERTPPLPTYLVAVAVGPWDVVDGPPLAANAVRKQALPLRGIGPRGTGPQLKWILEQTPAIVKFFEEYTQQPYPFDKLDLLGAPDFSAGAMENAGLIVFRDALLRLDATSPAGTARSSFDVTAHEIAHQWFGDLVTVPWWNDIWLNEAFASWAQGKASIALKPEFLDDLGRLEGTFGAMANDSLLSARRVRQPVEGQGDIENAFDGITYRKGAAVLRMFEEWIGEDRYRQAMRVYLAAHAFGSGSSDDLIAAIAQASGKGETLARAMRSFLDQPGIPLLHTALSCKAGKATLAVSQSRYLPYGVLSNDHLQWQVPMCVRVGHGDASERQCFLIDKPEQDVALAGACPDWYLPNADAAGYYRYTMAGADFAALGRQVAKLEPEEQMIFADAIKSAFARGDIGPALVLDAMPQLARSTLPQIAFALSGNLAWMREHLATEATRPALDAYAAQLYAPRLADLGWVHRAGESDADSRLRQRIVALLAIEMRDPATRRELNAMGRRALGLDGESGVDLTRIDPDLRGFALKVAVQDSGAPAFDAVLEQLAATHATQERYELVSALGATRDPQLAQRARDYGLTPSVAVGELSRLYGAQVEEPENRDAFWTWYQAHFDSLRARFPDASQKALPRWPAIGRCARNDAEELRQWLAPRIETVIGGKRALAQSIETVSQCAALREHVGEQSLAKWAEAHAR
jgi:alanyl aminopeptidase